LVEMDLAHHPFLGGESPSVADCTLFAGARFAARFGVGLPATCPRTGEWFSRFSSRKSAKLIDGPDPV